MRNKIAGKYLILKFCGIFAALAVSVFAQTEIEKPRIKNFGSSLKPQKTDKTARTKKENAGDEDVLRVETAIVVSDVLVLDKKGVAVRGLKKEDFVISEDGAPQTIESLSLGGATVPRSIVLVIDFSSSHFAYVKPSVEAAKVLVDKLKPNDKMAIVTEDVKLITNFTTNKKLLKEKLDRLKDNFYWLDDFGQSKEYSALYAVLNEMFGAQDVRPIVIFQTQGNELYNLKGNFVPLSTDPFRRPPRRIDWTERSFSFGDILTAAEKSRSSVFTVHPGIRMTGFSEAEQLERMKKDFNNRREALKEMGALPRRNPNSELLKQFTKNNIKGMLEREAAQIDLAKQTGGWAEFLETPEQADEVYTRILLGIESRYVIGYYPTNETKDGTRRTVKIEVRGHPEYIVWGRKTYFAPEPEK